MPTEDEYGERAKRLLRAAMVRQGVSYDALAERLTALGVPDTSANLRNKFSRGKFTAAFLLAVCDALKLSSLAINEE